MANILSVLPTAFAELVETAAMVTDGHDHHTTSSHNRPGRPFADHPTCALANSLG